MRYRVVIFRVSIILVVFFTMVSCNNDLKEELYSSLGQDNFYNNNLELTQAVERPYTHMQAWLSWSGESGYFYHNTLSGDMEAWPQKGPDGFDNGDHIRQHNHTWTPEEDRTKSAWELMWTGVGFTNTALEQIEQTDTSEIENITNEEYESIIAEAKVLRAFHYMKLMDLFGNIPIVTEVGEPTNPSTKSRKEVFDFVEQEILDNVEKLKPTSKETMGRVSKSVGYAMLSELYLNAKVWSGEDRWDDCIKYSDKVIEGEGGSVNGTLKLDSNPLGPFNNTNEESPEYIFGFPYAHDEGFAFDWRGIYAGFSNMAKALNVSYSGNNAFVVVPTGFDSYDDNDLRKDKWFLFGPQYKYDTDEPILGIHEYEGEPLIYVNSIRRNSEGQTGEGSMTEGEENSGARFNKYRSGTKDDEHYLDNDFVIYRLTEMYFNKAEALMRQNDGQATSEAVDLINQSKSRYFSDDDWTDERYTPGTLTMDELCAERGREFIFEGKRRTTLIRFDKFTSGTWWDKEPDGDDHTIIYPIPQEQIDANDSLKQNPGY